MRLTVGDGSSAQYRVREQLAGISFPSDAVGKAAGVSGAIEFAADGSIVSQRSKLLVDLRTLTSDQSMRDGFIKGPQVLNTEQYPLVEFVPKRAVGLPWPFPSAAPAQAGFQLIGDMTAHGVTKEVTWNVIATFGQGRVAGRADTELTFDTFAIPKPKLARLLSVDDAIKLEIELKLDPEEKPATTR
jgi:polyisoprenoid-binding protein YceI